MAALVRRYTKNVEDFHRKLILPVEDKPTAWSGGYRYFRSPNVIPIEHYRLNGQRSPYSGFTAPPNRRGGWHTAHGPRGAIEVTSCGGRMRWYWC